MAANIIQLRNFQNLLIDDREQAGTLISRLGFDKSKTFLYMQLFLNIILSSAILFDPSFGPKYLLISILSLIMNFQLYKKISDAKSPLSSSVFGLANHAVLYQVLFLLGVSSLLVWTIINGK